MLRFIRVFVLFALLAGVFASVAAAGGYTDASYYTPVGKVGTPYSHRVEWKPGTGCPPYTYAVVGGEFPPGHGVIAVCPSNSVVQNVRHRSPPPLA